MSAPDPSWAGREPQPHAPPLWVLWDDYENFATYVPVCMSDAEMVERGWKKVER